MQWKRIQSNGSPITRSIRARFSTRAFSFALCFLLGSGLYFSSEASRADDLLEYESEESSNDLSRVVSLMVGGLRASGASSGNITNDVAEILSILSSAWASGGSFLKTYPFAYSGRSLWDSLKTQLTERPNVNTGTSQDTFSYLYEIQRALYGQSGIPSESDALLPVLLRVNGALASLTNRTASVDLGSVTNLLSAIERVQSAIAANTNALYAGDGSSVGYNLGNISDFLLYDFAPVAGSLGDFLLSSPGGWDDFFGMVYLASQDTDQAFIPGQRAFRVTDTNSQALLSDIASALDDLSSSVDEVGDLVGTGLGIDQNGSSISDSLGDIEKGLTDIEWLLESIEDYTYYIHYFDLDYAQTTRSVQKDFAQLFEETGYSSAPMRSVQSDFATLISLLSHVGTNIVSHPSDEYQASTLNSEILYEESAGSTAMTDQISEDASTLSSALVTNQPDYSVSYFDNPMEPLTNGVANFRRRMESYLPDLDSLDTRGRTRVYLFKQDWDPDGLLTRRGSSRSSSDRWNGLGDVSFDLSGSDEKVPNQLLNYATTAMAWAWNLSACLLGFLMLREFWNWVASWRA